ncbi:MAG: hypothetical protein ACRDNZ_12595 [Streptosporangiaceae bacterium]
MTTTPPPLEDVIVTGLCRAFPGWTIRHASDGRWHATRRTPLPPARQPPGYAVTLTADAPRFLACEITRQPDRPVFRQHR